MAISLASALPAALLCGPQKSQQRPNRRLARQRPPVDQSIRPRKNDRILASRVALASDGRLRLAGVEFNDQNGAIPGVREDRLTELTRGVVAGTPSIWAAGVQFIDENGGGPGVRLRKNTKKNN